MEIHYGNGGWVKVAADELPGELYLRLERDSSGRWRTRDFYLRGQDRPVRAADLRKLNLSGVEEVVGAAAEHVEQRAATPGPDLALLASSYATTFGTGVYGYRDCGSCGAPLRGRSARVNEKWSGDWVALSWFAQLEDTSIRRPGPPKDESDVRTIGRTPRLQRPTAGLTTEFLERVRDAYNQAVAEGKAPAPALARQIASDELVARADAEKNPKLLPVRTIHKWVSIARQRGVMPPVSRGKAD